MASQSHIVDEQFWARSPDYFFKNLKPRLSRHADRADDSCLQAQIDTFGTEDIGTIAGSLASAGNFASLIYSESLPDRLPTLAYLNEILSFYEGFEDQMAQIMGSDMDDTNRVPKDPKFNNLAWQEGFKSSLMKIVNVLTTQDPARGGKCLMTLKELAETPYLGPKMDYYQTFDEYLDDRYLDIAWPSLFACAQFGAALHITPEVEKSLETVFRPLWLHSCCVYDHYTFDKAVKDSDAVGTNHKIINGIPLLQRLHGMDTIQAMEHLKKRCFEYEAQYLQQKDDYLDTHDWNSLSADVKSWFACQEAIATGFALWCATAYRHVSPYGAAYRSFYKQRIGQGVKYLANSGASADLLSGGFEATTRIE